MGTVPGAAPRGEAARAGLRRAVLPPSRAALRVCRRRRAPDGRGARRPRAQYVERNDTTGKIVPALVSARGAAMPRDILAACLRDGSVVPLMAVRCGRRQAERTALPLTDGGWIAPAATAPLPTGRRRPRGRRRQRATFDAGDVGRRARHDDGRRRRWTDPTPTTWADAADVMDGRERDGRERRDGRGRRDGRDGRGRRGAGDDGRAGRSRRRDATCLAGRGPTCSMSPTVTAPCRCARAPADRAPPTRCPRACRSGSPRAGAGVSTYHVPCCARAQI